MADPRVPKVKEEYKYGLKSPDLPANELYCFTWFAGLWIGQGGDTSELFEMLAEDGNSNLEAETIGSYIFEAVCFSTCRLQWEWLNLWQQNKESISNFFALMEAKSKTASLKINALNVLTRLIAAHVEISDPILINTTHLCRLELTESILNIESYFLPIGCIIKVEMEGIYLGLVEMPFVNGRIAATAIKQAIADKFGWKILKRYFDYTIYQNKLFELKGKESYGVLSEQLHEETGWLEFLRHVWAKPDWDLNDFYNPTSRKEAGVKLEVHTLPVMIEIGNPIAFYKVKSNSFIAVVGVGGVNIGTIHLPFKNRVVSSQSVIIEITKKGGYPFCVACIAQALVGFSLSETTSILHRLQKAMNAAIDSKNSIALPILSPE